MRIVLLMADNTEVIVTSDGYECPSMPNFAEVLMLAFPPCISQKINAERLRRRYNWQIKPPEKAEIKPETVLAGV